MQHDFGYHVGFGEIKPVNSPTKEHSVCMDILRLGVASKRSIDKWHLGDCLAFMINNLDMLSNIGHCFWNHCNTIDATLNVEPTVLIPPHIPHSTTPGEKDVDYSWWERPPYSFLNPIEKCWSKIKSNMKRKTLDNADTLTSRLPAACGSVTVQDCQVWVRHAETFWDRNSQYPILPSQDDSDQS
ncbi:hypothetical protein J3Q64DRAFT_1833561 [Phycomyces blakesleeanus]|uniref:Tc1-like transposase DDE domain-containing protein n=1 Tax=Phycomyces blakesleeanus TaxID=4837 RepID=A0ABR3B133_PHYBL